MLSFINCPICDTKLINLYNHLYFQSCENYCYNSSCGFTELYNRNIINYSQSIMYNNTFYMIKYENYKNYKDSNNVTVLMCTNVIPKYESFLMQNYLFRSIDDLNKFKLRMIFK
jgi:hypothetical protein